MPDALYEAGKRALLEGGGPGWWLVDPPVIDNLGYVHVNALNSRYRDRFTQREFFNRFAYGSFMSPPYSRPIDLFPSEGALAAWRDYSQARSDRRRAHDKREEFYWNTGTLILGLMLLAIVILIPAALIHGV